ncbi:MAG TPA: hypothetical protein PL137_15980, partial [Nocardioides sp.]|nr:hypothetical protein [Nocardioides sp.]
MAEGTADVGVDSLVGAAVGIAVGESVVGDGSEVDVLDGSGDRDGLAVCVGAAVGACVGEAGAVVGALVAEGEAGTSTRSA